MDKRNQQALWETFLQQWMPRNYTDFENSACVTYPDGARRDEALPAPTEVNEFQSLLLQLFISGANEQRKSGRGWPNLLSEDHLMPLTSYVIIFLVLFWPYNFLAPLFISQFAILSSHLHVLSHHLDFPLIILNNLSYLHFLFSFSKLSPFTFVIS